MGSDPSASLAQTMGVCGWLRSGGLGSWLTRRNICRCLAAARGVLIQRVGAMAPQALASTAQENGGDAKCPKAWDLGTRHTMMTGKIV